MRLSVWWFLGLLALQGMAVFVGLHLVWNPTASMPRGFYWQQAPRPVRIGDTVRFIPPDDALRYLGGFVPEVALLKEVVAIEGQTVCWDVAQMTVDDLVLPRQPQHAFPPGGLGCQRVPAGMLAVRGLHPNSLDSRQLGLLDQRRVVARVIPVWTWGGAQ